MLTMPRPVSAKHPTMSARERAAQFSPFAALSGFEKLVEEQEYEQGLLLEARDIISVPDEQTQV